MNLGEPMALKKAYLSSEYLIDYVILGVEDCIFFIVFNIAYIK